MIVNVPSLGFEIVNPVPPFIKNKTISDPTRGGILLRNKVIFVLNVWGENLIHMP